MSRRSVRLLLAWSLVALVAPWRVVAQDVPHAGEAGAGEVEAPPPAAPREERAAEAEAPAAEGTAALPGESLFAQARPDAAATGAEAGLSVAELESLGLNDSESGVDTSFHFSGFADFTVFYPIKPHGAGYAAYASDPSMYVGNLNAYVSKQLSESFRTMAEVRFTYLPNGAKTVGSSSVPDPNEPAASTQVSDYAQLNHTTRWGGIMIQRAYLDWTLHRYAVLRAGQFLTPYGIWNVDHGSPAIIPVQRPQAIDNGLFPEQQTGFELFGRVEASSHATVGYHLTLSNGTGPVSEYRDLDRNKAVGGRLYWESTRVGMFRFGTSAYYGQDTNATNVWGLDKSGAVDFTKKVLTQYDQLGLAGDLLFKYRGLHLQAEIVSIQRRFTKKGRTEHDIALSPVPQGFSSDHLSWGSYALLAYLLPWYGLTPFVEFEYAPEHVADAAVTGIGYHGGLNAHPADAVTLKTEFEYLVFESDGPLFKDPVRALQFQFAWAF